MFVHNLKVAVRNLMKYRLQTVISVLSIAIGIVTLAIAHAVLARTTVPSIYSRPYYDRTYTLWLAPANSYVHGTNEGAALPVTDDILRALKRDGGLKSAEQMAVPNFMIMGDRMEFFLNDTTARMWQWNYTPIDPGYLHLVGIRSAITGRVIDRLKAGEAVISRQMASRIFGKDCPVGAVTREPIAECPIPITIVDVYDDLSIYDLPLDDQFMYISLGEPGGDLDGHNPIFRAESHHVRDVVAVHLGEFFLLAGLLALQGAEIFPVVYSPDYHALGVAEAVCQGGAGS